MKSMKSSDPDGSTESTEGESEDMHESERTVTSVCDAPPSTVMLRVPAHRMITQEMGKATPLGQIAAGMSMIADGIETSQIDM
jgi:hypothetical protein